MPIFILMLKSTAPVRLVIEKLIYILESRDKYYSDYQKEDYVLDEGGSMFKAYIS